MRRIAVLLADTHGGHKLSLCNPDAILFDDSGFPADEPKPYRWTLWAIQEWLWDCYKEDIAFVVDLADGDPISVFHNGDVVWGDKYIDQVISPSIANQARIGAANLMPWTYIPNVDAIRLIHGTIAHDYGLGAVNDVVAQYITAQVAREIDIATSRHAVFRLGNHRFDCSHKGPTAGGRKWLEGNELRYYLRSAMMEDIIRGETPPDVYVRAHFHTYALESVTIKGGSFEQVWQSSIVLCPSYCGMTHHAQAQIRSKYLLDCGLIAVELIDSQPPIFHPHWRQVDLRQEETL